MSNAKARDFPELTIILSPFTFCPQKSINDNFLVPQHFPWCTKKRLPQKLVKSLPRDIDDLPLITHCEEELHAPFGGDFRGPFGFGKYENGQSRGHYSDVSPAENLKPDGITSAAAARRSHDPGVLELNVQTKLPSSIDAVMNPEDPSSSGPAEKWNAELMKNPEHAKMLSHLPFRWEKRAECPHPAAQQVPQEVATAQDDSYEWQKLAQSRLRSKAQTELATSCMRKWRISVKVGGVSSRSTLFLPSTVVKSGRRHLPENTRKVVRPMLCLASLPQHIQSGQTVSMDKALAMDRSDLARSLGSYDCRFTDALLNPKKDMNRVKRIEVGRTRLVWSNLIDDPSMPSTRNRAPKAVFNSLITGQRVDASKCKRPTEVKVGVRLNGRIITEEALEELPTTTSSNVRKRTRQAENESPPKKSRIQCPESRTEEEINAALRSNSIFAEGKPLEDRFIQQGSGNGVVYLEVGASQSHSEIDRNDIISSLLKFNQKKSAQKRLKQSASSDTLSTDAPPASFGGSQVIKKSTPPRFACAPLEDGLLRTVCLNSGNMAAIAVHQVIRDVSEQESVRRCSVCWSDEGSGKDGVLECVKCGLLAHSKCCRDKGEFTNASSGSPEGPESKPLTLEDTKQDGGGNVKTAELHDDQAEQWQCAVCSRYTVTRRNPRMPQRFSDGETYTSSNHAEDNGVANRNANMPGPRCSLCPHRGGAMSQLESNSDSSNKWTHEVCRVWSGLDLSNSPKSEECSSLFQQFPNGSPLSTVCALCGTGGVKDDKSKQFTGLTRCAARGCLVAFHPMCALLASKVGMDERSSSKAKSVRTRKTRHSDQLAEEKKSDDTANIEADKKLCSKYTLQVVQLSKRENTIGGGDEDTDDTVIIPVAFCGIHNPLREDSFFGRLPGGAVC